jgi:predicted DNA-binding protein (MmcQ/YjbR family)
MKVELTKTIARNFSLFKHVPFLPNIIDEQLKVYTLLFRPIVFSKMILFVSHLKALENVQVAYHKFGGLEFRIFDKEFCHIHGDGLVDIRVNKEISSDLIERSIAEPHHVNPKTSWISFPIKSDTELERLLKIVELAYNLRSKDK